MTQLVQMETPLAGLHASAPEPLPFGRTLQMRAFLLKRTRGNVLVYAAGALAEEAGAIEALGGVSRRYLTHHHEAAFATDGIDAPLFVHTRDRVSVSDRRPVRATFSRRHVLDEDLEVIPIPGHTRGATALLWDSGEQRVLFTGDTLFLRDGEWVPAVLGSSDPAAYLDSLALLRELDFDVLAPWIATAGGPYVAPTDRDDARRRIDAISARIRAGGSG